MRLPLCCALVAAALPGLRAQDPADAAWRLTLQLSRVNRHAKAALEHQPDYTCLATFERFHWPVNRPVEQKIDTVRVEVAYVGGRELYSWPGEGKFSDIPLTRMVGAGMIGDGDFAAHAHNVFVYGNAQETFDGEEEKDGRKLWRYHYRSSPFRTGWTVQHFDARQMVGAEGSFWVDVQTLDLVRMETHAADFLPGFPLKSVVSTVDYGQVRIGDQDVLLPLRGELTTTTTEGNQSRNLTEYSNCRQYAGQSTISFGALPEPAAPTPAAPETVESRLPVGLSLQIRLSSELNLARATVGDPVEGTLAAPLHEGKREIVPKGATVRGRVRLLTRDSSGGIQFSELGLVFDELEFAGHLIRFTSKLKSFDSAVTGVRMSMITNRVYTDNELTEQEISPTKLQGASVFFLDASASGLPKGALMTWRTQ